MESVIGEFGFQLVKSTKHQANQYGAAERSQRKDDGSFPNAIRAYYAVYQPVKDSKKMKCLSYVNRLTSTLRSLKDYDRIVLDRQQEMLANSLTAEGLNAVAAEISEDAPRMKKPKHEGVTPTTGSSLPSASFIVPAKPSSFPETSFIAPTKPRHPGVPLFSFKGNPEEVTVLESRSQPGRFYRFYRRTGVVEWIL
jgi:hypothetical protein